MLECVGICISVIKTKLCYEGCSSEENPVKAVTPTVHLISLHVLSDRTAIRQCIISFPYRASYLHLIISSLIFESFLLYTYLSVQLLSECSVALSDMKAQRVRVISKYIN